MDFMNIILDGYDMFISEYMRNASITKERRSNTWYMFQIDILHLRISFALKKFIIHMLKSFVIIKKGEIVDSMP